LLRRRHRDTSGGEAAGSLSTSEASAEAFSPTFFEERSATSGSRPDEKKVASGTWKASR
jgi:hypothetical protein